MLFGITDLISNGGQSRPFGVCPFDLYAMKLFSWDFVENRGANIAAFPA
jgi:hypothetical protein